MIHRLTIYLFLSGLLSVKLQAQNAHDTLAIRHRVDSLAELGQKLYSVLKGKPELVTSGLPVLRALPPSVLLFQSYQMLANTYVRNGENELARSYLDSCLDIAYKLKQKRLIARSKYLEGIYLKFNGKSDRAIKNWFEAVETFREVHDEDGELSALSAIAREYNDLDQHDKAEKYLKEIIDRKQKLNDRQGLAHSYNTLANVYTDTKRYEEAIGYFQKAITVSLLIKDTVNLAYTYNNIARVYNKQNRLDEAQKNWEKSYDLFMHNSGDAFGVAMIMNNMSYVYTRRKDYRRAIGYALQAVDYATAHDIQMELLRAHQNLMDAYYGLNDFESGYKEYEIILEMKDAQFNKDVAGALADAEQKYKAKIRQDSLVLLNADKKLNTVLLEKQRTSILSYQVGLVTILLLMIAVAALAYVSLKNKRARELLLQQEKLNEAIFETEQAERERIARDLHDSVGQKLSVVKMQMSLHPSDQSRQAMELLDKAIHDVRVVSHDLFPEELGKGLFAALEDMAAQINYTSASTKLRLSFPPDPSAIGLSRQTELYLYRIIQEQTNNALKYAQAGNIHISMEVKSEQLQVILSDDGVGLPETATPTDGIGMKNMKARIDQLKGKLQIVSRPHGGTQFMISIPL